MSVSEKNPVILFASADPSFSAFVKYASENNFFHLAVAKTLDRMYAQIGEKSPALVLIDTEILSDGIPSEMLERINRVPLFLMLPGDSYLTWGKWGLRVQGIITKSASEKTLLAFLQQALGSSQEVMPALDLSSKVTTRRLLNPAYYRIIDTLPIGIMIIKQGRPIFMNKEAERLMGYKMADLPQPKLTELINSAHPDLWNNISKDMRVELEDKLVCLKDSEGKERRMELSVTTESPNEHETLIVVKEVAIQSHLDQAINQALLAQVGTMASGLMHEIRNPLAGLLATTEVFRNQFAKTDERLEFIDKMVHEIERLSDLVKNFSSFIYPRKPKFSAISLTEVIDSVITLQQKKIAQKHVFLKTYLHSDMLKIFGEKVQLEQVVLNLLLNAWDAVEPGGQIHIQTYIHDNKKMAGFKITDNGKGIKEEEMKRLFTPFFTTKSDGMGLGLSIAARIVESHRGKIEVQSKPGEGTTFNVWFPAIPRNE